MDPVADAARRNVRKCVSRGRISHYVSARMELSPESPSESTCRVDVPFPDVLKNAGVFMIEKARLVVHDPFGRVDNGVFGILDQAGACICPGDAVMTRDKRLYSGFLADTVSCDVLEPESLVGVINALRNSPHRDVVTAALEGARRFADPSTGVAEGASFQSVCKSCGTRSTISRTGNYYMLPGEDHCPESRCPVPFDPAGNTDAEHLIRLFCAATALPSVRGILTKYVDAASSSDPFAGKLPSRCILVPRGFVSYLLALWDTVLLNARRVCSSGITKLVVELRRKMPVDAENASINVFVQLDVVQFLWDDPEVCAAHLSKLLLPENRQPGAVLSLAETIRTQILCIK